MDTAKQFTNRTLREAIEVGLAQCTEPQQAFFHRIFSKGVADSELEHAFDLVQRTLAKNETDPERKQ